VNYCARILALVSRFQTRFTRFVPSPLAIVIAALSAAVLAPATACANPVLGFIEEFPGTSVGSFSGGTPFSNPGTGGYLGPADGFLLLENTAPAALGSRGTGLEYAGNWTAAGITQIRVWLNDVGADDPLDIHLSIGNGTAGTANFWQYDVGFSPPLHAWGEYVMDLSGTNWTRILGSGTFSSALTNVDRVHLRHDPPPFAMIPNQPDAIAGDVGIDHLLLTNGLVGVEPFSSTAAHPVELAPPYPNPSRGPVTLALRAAEAGPVRIEILDVTGRSVRSTELAGAGSGPRTWLWDGLDDAGRKVVAGYYRVRATGTGGGTSRSLVRIN
jgi:flagellar hook capping protein FlgD